MTIISTSVWQHETYEEEEEDHCRRIEVEKIEIILQVPLHAFEYGYQIK